MGFSVRLFADTATPYDLFQLTLVCVCVCTQEDRRKEEDMRMSDYLSLLVVHVTQVIQRNMFFGVVNITVIFISS